MTRPLPPFYELRVRWVIYLCEVFCKPTLASASNTVKQALPRDFGTCERKMEEGSRLDSDGVRAFLVPERPRAAEDHGDAVLVADFDGLFVAGAEIGRAHV